MKQALDTIKGRVIVVLIVFLSLSQLLGLWIYVQRSNMTTGLLHDALLADCIASITNLAERTPVEDRAAILKLVSGPLIGFSLASESSLGESLPEGTRLHFYEHMLSAFLERPLLRGLRVGYEEKRGQGIQDMLATMHSSAHVEVGHIPNKPLAEIRPLGMVTTEVQLADGSWVRAVSPLLGVSPFSTWKFGAALAVMLTSVLIVAGWVMQRWTQPLTYFAAAAERFGTDIQAPYLRETGPLEVRTAAKAFNRMQAQIRRLVQDRTALAAAIAHDLGTPITRLRLRVEEIADEEIRKSIVQDLHQMQRMIAATLGFARLDFAAELPDVLDLMSLIQRVADDISRTDADIEIHGPMRLPVRSKPIALQRALMNVAENALKYGKKARIYVTERAGAIEIAVEDDGPGIPEALQGEVFEPFYRLPQKTDAVIDGSGLGLAVARSLVRGIGGEIMISNRSEGGLRVAISIPSVSQTIHDIKKNMP